MEQPARVRRCGHGEAAGPATIRAGTSEEGNDLRSGASESRSVQRRREQHDAGLDAKPVVTPLALRPYQREAVDRILAVKRGIIQAPPGAGKSAIIGGILAATPRKCWLVLVHRRLLETQLTAQLCRYGVSGVGALEAAGTTARVVVSTWQSVYAHHKRGAAWIIRLLASIDGVCVDEVQCAPSPCLSSLLEQTNTEYRVGLSATPLLRQDGRNKWTLGFFGDVAYRIEAPGLADAGALSKPTVKFAPAPPTHGSGYRATVVDNAVRNRVLGDIAAKTPKPALVLVNHVEHGQRLYEELATRSLRVRFLSQTNSDAERDDGIAKLRSGALDALIATPIFDAGVDIPELASVVVASGGRSAIACIQRLGRVMRPAPGKTQCQLWDIADEGTDRVKENAAERAKAYAMAGFDVAYDSRTVVASVQPQRGFADVPGVLPSRIRHGLGRATSCPVTYKPSTKRTTPYGYGNVRPRFGLLDVVIVLWAIGVLIMFRLTCA